MSIEAIQNCRSYVGKYSILCLNLLVTYVGHEYLPFYKTNVDSCHLIG